MSIVNRIPAVLLKPRTWLAIYLLVFVAVTLHRLLLEIGILNNFKIFRESFFNLTRGADLYAGHPDLYSDLFKYSPGFAALMAPFSVLSAAFGLIVWTGLNMLAPLWAIQKLSLKPSLQALVLLFILPSLTSSVQVAQSNGLMLALMLGGFQLMENQKPVWAALLLCLGFYTKFFPAVVGILFVFHGRKARFLLALLFWLVLFAVLPLLFTPADSLVAQYKSWGHLLAHDNEEVYHYSIMTFFGHTFGIRAPDAAYVIPGFAFLMLPLFRVREINTCLYRFLWLSALLLWVVVFNPHTESPTLVIAAAGAILWFVVQPCTRLSLSLLILVFVLTVLSPTDVFPRVLRETYVNPYALMIFPCLLTWGAAMWLLLRAKPGDLKEVFSGPECDFPAKR